MVQNVNLGPGGTATAGAGAAGAGACTHAAEPLHLGRPRRILIMDDDRGVREMMRRQLKAGGHEVTVTACGEEAVRAYRRARGEGRSFDVVILDLVVDPGWGGEQTLEALLSLDPGVRAVVCSGSLAAAKQHYESKGFCGVLGKPYALADLHAALAAALTGGAKP
jgi:CheY-like chemotaxis protein